MDLVHMATCSIRWAILWSTESIKIRQNQEKDFGGFRIVGTSMHQQVVYQHLGRSRPQGLQLQIFTGPEFFLQDQSQNEKKMHNTQFNVNKKVF